MVRFKFTGYHFTFCVNHVRSGSKVMSVPGKSRDHRDAFKQQVVLRALQAAIAYNDDYYIFKVEDNQMSEYPPIEPIRGITSQLAEDWEILETFFSSHNIEPHWDNCGYVWGWYEPELAGWTGCMGKVSVSCCQ